MKKFIDLSVSLEEGITSDPDFMLPKINYHHHKDTAEEIISFFPGLKKEDLPGGEGGRWKPSRSVHIMGHIWTLLITTIQPWTMEIELLR